MKYSKGNRLVIAFILVGLGSVYLLATYSGMGWIQLWGFMLATLQLLAAMLLLALLLAVVIRLLRKLLGRLGTATQDEPPSDNE